MSWLNLNDSLNTLKGQISSFANNVLADEDDRKDAASSNTELEELRTICKKQQEEISYLQKLNSKPSHGGHPSTLSKDVGQPDSSWSWEVSDLSPTEKDKTEEIIANLKKTVTELQQEKQELTSNLVLLDTEHQITNEKLINMKNQLQRNYDELEEEYNKLKEENESLAGDKKKIETEIDALKLKATVEKNENETCRKCETLIQENQALFSETEKLSNEISVLKSNNMTLQKVLDDSKTANEEEYVKLEEKLKLYESENKILVSELKKATQSITTFEKKIEVDAQNCKKLASILEGYEHQVSSLKQELVAQNETNNKMRKDVEELQEQLQQAIQGKEQTHSKYVNILTENMKKYIDGDKLCEEETNLEDVDHQVLEFNHQVKNILNILLDLKGKCESLEKDLYNVTEEKTNILSEKNHEIEKLIQNSEILSQEVITKSQTIKDYENECSELIKNNDMLINELKIFKNNSGLQTISESNEDNILLLESQLETANKKIEELEGIVSQKTNFTEKCIIEESNEKFEELVEESNNLRTENLSLKEQFEKSKDSFVLLNEEKENLTSAIEKMRIELENTEYQYTEININMEVLKEEVENQKKRIEELTEGKLSVEKLNLELERNNEDIRTELNLIREKLLLEEDSRKQCESQIRNLTEKLQNAKMNETSLKLQYDTINRELISVNEAKNTLETNLKNSLQTLTQCRDEFLILQSDNETLRSTIAKLEDEHKKAIDTNNELNVTIKQFNELKVQDTQIQTELQNDHQAENHFENVKLEEKIQQNGDLPARFDDLKSSYDSILDEKLHLNAEIEKLNSVANEHLTCLQNIKNLEKKLEELEGARNELTNVIITKHQESVTYHNEIQRLTQVLNAEVEKNRNLDAQIQMMKTAMDANPELEKKDVEIDKLTDQNNFLRQKGEVLAQNLLEEQARVQKILADHSSASEKEQALSKKLERLQTHLIEVEEHYTQELLKAEEKNTELQAKVNEIEQREKDSSTMYTSVSIRANQHVETLQHQLQLITNQRDDLRKKISDMEDHTKKQETALANLQFVLEQFQKDKEKDVQVETERLRRQIIGEKKIQEDLKKEISNLQSHLEESKHGLLAASRLSDQLEQSKQINTTLKTEVSQLKENLQKSEEQLQNLSSQSDGKVDKSLIKNLVIGFASTNANLNRDQIQILKIIATVLDFNQQDHDKVKLSKPQQGWLSSFLSPQSSQGMSQESLSQAFVKFLENESKPRLVPSLLHSSEEAPKSRKSSTASRQSPGILSEVVLPTFADFAQNRNSSSILKDVLKDNS